jgi:outer membrane protein assembly factor BamB
LILKVSAIVVVGAIALGLVLAVSARETSDDSTTGVGSGRGAAQAALAATTTTTSTTIPEGPPTPQPTPTPTPYDGWVDPASSGSPWGEVEGVLTFRGSPTRSFYGTGPVPLNPEVIWTFPESAMCGSSTVGTETTQWCGTGWTGQPAVFERDGETWVTFGAYDYNVHFLDGETGGRRLPDFPTGDIIKGSATVDPDGYPIVYIGSRDNFLRAIAIDREEPTELWRLDANSITPRLWNDDWDGAPLVIDDYLFEGGENSVFHVVKLNRSYDDSGLVTVDPELVFTVPGWDDELTSLVGSNVSIENSVAISGNTAYFANSGGLVQGWDLTGLEEGVSPTRVFRWWAGDDVDASVVVDDEGMLYVGVEYERGNQRSLDVGQLQKLDPSRPDDPLVWSVEDTGPLGERGIWATPAVSGDMVYASTNGGRVMGIDRYTGEIVWEKLLPAPVWSSQVVVDEVLIQGDCSGVLHAYDVSDPLVDPPEIWSVQVGGCIESTPAIWGGAIYVGTRGGQFHKVADSG